MEFNKLLYTCFFFAYKQRNFRLKTKYIQYHILNPFNFFRQIRVALKNVLFYRLCLGSQIFSRNLKFLIVCINWKLLFYWAEMIRSKSENWKKLWFMIRIPHQSSTNFLKHFFDEFRWVIFRIFEVPSTFDDKIRTNLPACTIYTYFTPLITI